MPTSDAMEILTLEAAAEIQSPNGTKFKNTIKNTMIATLPTRRAIMD
jgi:hypothetical protein